MIELKRELKKVVEDEKDENKNKTTLVMSGHRKKPFSHKQKKSQLAEKKLKKQNSNPYEDLHTAPAATKKLVSQFDKLNTAQVIMKREEAMRQLSVLPKEALEVSFDEIYPDEQIIAIPKRPEWNYAMSKEELEKSEQESFDKWMTSIYELYDKEELSYFEKNIEVWRQLWRVVEISDIIIIVVDIRNPIFHFNPSLYHFIIEMKKIPLVVFMKVDLVSPEIYTAWEEYFSLKFPELKFAACSIYASENNCFKRKRYDCSTGIKELLCKLQDISIPFTDSAAQWKYLIDQRQGIKSSEKINDSGRLVTVGLIGHPNVGKSSLINSIVGKKVCSASRSPGHTKHFQTIHLSPSIRLCDCPGLVLPSVISKSVQILSGIFPIAQVRDPYHPLIFAAERIPLATILNVGTSEDNPFLSAWGICEELAIKKGFYTAKGARPDVYRAANLILRTIVDGKIVVCWKPKGFYQQHVNFVESFTATSNFTESVEIESSEYSLEESEEGEEESNSASNPFDLLLESE